MVRSDKSHVGLALCFYCLKNHTKVLLDTRLRESLLHEQVIDMEPCDECHGYMGQGVILIGATSQSLENIEAERERHETWCDSKFHGPGNRRRPPFIPNPHRTGQWLVVSEVWVNRVIHPAELRDHVLKCRWTFVEEEVAQNLLEANEQLEADQEVAEEAAANES